jgi:bifunctional UDP-N-acetylglucosamine pyrophosphorylase/glucosamine-1-phosphate N-acetyltransferase
MNICAVVMAAGEGRQMASKHAKFTLPIAGKPMIGWVRDALNQAGAQEQVYIVGHRQEEVRSILGEDVAFVLQEHQLGTGHAVMQASHFLEGRRGCTIVINGDMPLITSDTLKNLIDIFHDGSYAAVVLTANAPDPTGYGRIIRDDEGNLRAIVEERDADEKQCSLCEINAGLYCFDTALLLSALGRIGCLNKQHEYYLTDTIEILIKDGNRVAACKTEFDEIMGVKDRIQLQSAAYKLNYRILAKHMRQGVSIVDPDTTWIDDSVIIGMDTTILPSCSLHGESVIGEESVIGPDTHLHDTRVGNNVQLNHVTARSAEIEEGTVAGPYVQIRPGSVVGPYCRLGNFVEIKNSTIGAYSQLVHQTYVGDADVGENVNFGCGCSTANYDGLNKSRTAIGSHAFIGSNSCLVSPVSVEENAYVAAGTTVTETVPSYSLAISRARQLNKENWVISRGRTRNQRVNP